MERSGVGSGLEAVAYLGSRKFSHLSVSQASMSWRKMLVAKLSQMATPPPTPTPTNTPLVG